MTATMKPCVQFGIEYATRQCEALLREGAPGLHFYTLNRVRSTTEVARNLALDGASRQRFQPQWSGCLPTVAPRTTIGAEVGSRTPRTV